MPKLAIRSANETDFEVIHQFIHSLAVYEKEPHAHITSAEQYIIDYKDKWFDVDLAELENEVVGMLFYYNAYSTWKGRTLYLEDFIVKESFRNQGIGQKLFSHLIEVARNRKCNLIRWQVLNWNQPAIDFYRKNKAEIESGWLNGKILLI